MVADDAHVRHRGPRVGPARSARGSSSHARTAHEDRRRRLAARRRRVPPGDGPSRRRPRSARARSTRPSPAPRGAAPPPGRDRAEDAARSRLARPSGLTAQPRLLLRSASARRSAGNRQRAARAAPSGESGGSALTEHAALGVPRRRRVTDQRDVDGAHGKPSIASPAARRWSERRERAVRSRRSAGPRHPSCSEGRGRPAAGRRRSAKASGVDGVRSAPSGATIGSGSGPAHGDDRQARRGGLEVDDVEAAREGEEIGAEIRVGQDARARAIPGRRRGRPGARRASRRPPAGAGPSPTTARRHGPRGRDACEARRARRRAADTASSFFTSRMAATARMTGPVGAAEALRPWRRDTRPGRSRGRVEARGVDGRREIEEALARRSAVPGTRPRAAGRAGS